MGKYSNINYGLQINAFIYTICLYHVEPNPKENGKRRKFSDMTTNHNFNGL